MIDRFHLWSSTSEEELSASRCIESLNVWSSRLECSACLCCLRLYNRSPGCFVVGFVEAYYCKTLYGVQQNIPLIREFLHFFGNKQG